MVSKKKSYMDRNNILSEGFLDSILKFLKLGKKTKSQNLSKEDKQILKDPQVKSALNNFNKEHKKSIKILKKQYDKYGFEYPDWVDWKK
jgi:hypothetical protein